ncbi:MAG TPA: hypothetical protein PKL53_08220 [Methylotenera sp.]|nr:hypothetical protein [Methylotenera sp.]HPV45833.1 hypothetical protein [Methylotenera sp.]
MNLIQNFIFITISQTIFFLFVAAIEKKTPDEISKALLYGVIVGIPFGLTYDIYVGKTLGIFSYRLGWSLNFLVINAFFSYGIAIATVRLLNLKKQPSVKPHICYKLLVFIIISSCIVYLIGTSHFSNTFVCGLLIVVMSDYLITSRNISGIYKSFLASNYSSILKIYFLSVLMGAWYEISNQFFPVWDWTLSMYMSNLQAKITIVMLGYFALVYSITFILSINKKS